jgi:hypothetical protein
MAAKPSCLAAPYLGMEISGGGAFFIGAGPRKVPNTPSSVGLLTPNQLFDRAAQPRARLVGDMRDVVHPFIMQDRQHHPQQPGRRGLDPEHEREQRGGNSEVRHQEPRDDPSRSKLLPRIVRYLTNLLRKACQSHQVPCQWPKTAFFPIPHNSSGLEVQMAPKKSVTHFATQSRAIFVGQREKG